MICAKLSARESGMRGNSLSNGIESLAWSGIAIGNLNSKIATIIFFLLVCAQTTIAEAQALNQGQLKMLGDLYFQIASAGSNIPISKFKNSQPLRFYVACEISRCGEVMRKKNIFRDVLPESFVPVINESVADIRVNVFDGGNENSSSGPVDGANGHWILWDATPKCKLNILRKGNEILKAEISISLAQSDLSAQICLGLQFYYASGLKFRDAKTSGQVLGSAEFQKIAQDQSRVEQLFRTLQYLILIHNCSEFVPGTTPEEIRSRISGDSSCLK